MTAMHIPDAVLSANRHVVRHLKFDVAFANEAQAFYWQERLEDFMRGSGRDAIRAVFDEFSVADQVIAFDQLDIDLGDFRESDDFTVWQDRLGSVLRDTLRHELVRHQADPARHAAAVPRQQSAWQALTHYLTNGHLSWRNSNTTIADLIAAALRQDGAIRLVAWLRAHARPDRALRRLVPHLTDAQYSRLLAILTPTNARDLDAAMHSNIMGQTDQTGREQRLKLLAALLRCDVHADALSQADAAIEALPTLAFAMAQAASSSLNPRSPFAQARLWAQTWRKLINALQAEDSARLEVIWRDCLRLSGRRLRRALLDLGQYTEQRRRVARVFSHAMLLELLGLFAPDDAEFIASLIQHTEAVASGVPAAAEDASRNVDISAVVDSTNNGARETTVLRRHLWEFTLTHLLTDRGSVFNRRAYAAGVLQAAALSEGFDYLDLLQSMMRVLRADAVATGLRRQLLQLLAELTETARQDRAGINAQHAHDRDVAQSVKARQSHCQRFAAALAAGDAYALHTMLLYGDAANVTSTTNDIQWLAGELRRLAQTPDWADSRRRLAATLSDYALGTIADALAPGEGSFIAVTITVIAPVAVEEGSTGRTLQRARYTLWEFTLTYLMSDRGSRFNRQSYIRGVLHHMAEASGMHYLELVEALRQSFARMPRPGQLQRQMAAFIEELREDANLKPSTTAAPESRTERAWRARIANALQRTDESCWQRIWTEWAPRTPQVLREELLALAQQPQMLQRLVRSLPAHWRAAMLQLLLPEQSDFVARVIASGEAAARVMRDGSAGSTMGTGMDSKRVHDALWEFSLLFVLGLPGMQGGVFNRRAYAAFLLRKLAARSGIEYAALLLRITELLQHLPSAKDAPDDLTQILLELGLSHRTHASESALHSQSAQQQSTRVPNPSDTQSFDAMANAMTDMESSKHHHFDDKPTYETLLQLLMSMLRAQHAIPDVAVAKVIVAWLDGDTSLLRAVAASAAMSHALALPSRHNGPPSDGKQPATPAIPSSPPTMAQAVRQEIDVWLRVPGRAASFATALSAGQRALLLQGMRSADYRAVIELAARMAARCRLYFANAQTFEKGLAFDMQWLETEQWRFIFQYFFEEVRLFSAHDFLHRLATHLGAQERMVSLAHVIAKTNINIRAILLDDSSAPSARASSPATSSASLNPKTQSQSRVGTGVADIDTPREAVAKSDDDVDPIYITNAGLVLLSHYLPPLFDKLGLIRENRLADDAAVARAIAATQVLVAGVTPLVEADLTLNKLLCGVSPDFVYDAEVTFSPDEQALIDGLLQAVIAHWRALGQTSVAGLRESFLQREGCLSRKDDAWQLLVETRSYDMLLDRLPWGFATIKYSWMPGAIRVDWR